MRAVCFERLRPRPPTLLLTGVCLALAASPLVAQERGSLLWRYEADGDIGFYEVSPLGTLIVSSDNRTVALEPSSGEIVWSSEELRDCRPGTRRKGLLGSEATGEDVCRVGDGEDYEVNLYSDLPFLLLARPDRLVAYRLETGEPMWSSDVVGFPLAEENGWALEADLGRVVVWSTPSDEDTLRVAAIDLVEGTVDWTVTLPIVEELETRVGPGVRFFWGKAESGDRTVAAIRLQDGEVVFRSEEMAHPIVDDVEAFGTFLRWYFWGKSDSGDWNLAAVASDDGHLLFESEELAEAFRQDQPRLLRADWRALVNLPEEELQTLLDQPLDVLYTDEEMLTAFDWQTGAVRWRLEDFEVERWVYDRETIYTVHDGDVSAVDLENGTIRWRTGTDAMDWLKLDAHGLFVGCDFSVCVQGAQLLDPATGEARWPEPLEVRGRDFLWREDDLLILHAAGVIRFDLATGQPSPWASFEFEGDEVPATLAETESGLVALSDQNILGLDPGGTVRFQEYYEAPGLSTGDKILRIVGAAAATGLSQYQASRRAAYVDDPVTTMLYTSPGAPGTLQGEVGYSVYLPDLQERLAATEAAEERIYMYTEDPDGFSLIRFDAERGAEEGRAWLQERDPEFELDHVSGIVFLKKTARTIEAHEFRE